MYPRAKCQSKERAKWNAVDRRSVFCCAKERHEIDERVAKLTRRDYNGWRVWLSSRSLGNSRVRFLHQRLCRRVRSPYDGAWSKQVSRALVGAGAQVAVLLAPVANLLTCVKSLLACFCVHRRKAPERHAALGFVFCPGTQGAGTCAPKKSRIMKRGRSCVLHDSVR